MEAETSKTIASALTVSVYLAGVFLGYVFGKHSISLI